MKSKSDLFAISWFSEFFQTIPFPMQISAEQERQYQTISDQNHHLSPHNKPIQIDYQPVELPNHYSI
jgi:hypothetical protein